MRRCDLAWAACAGLTSLLVACASAGSHATPAAGATGAAAQPGTATAGVAAQPAAATAVATAQPAAGVSGGAAQAAAGAAERAPQAAAGATGVAAQPLITYCDLVSPPFYHRKQARVVGIYREGFEWAELYSTQCPKSYTTWVEWPQGSRQLGCPDIPGGDRIAFQPPERGHGSGATYGVILRGTLVAGDELGYGHMNAYTFELDVDCVEHAELLFSDSPVEGALSRAMRREIERFLARTDPAKARRLPPASPSRP